MYKAFLTQLLDIEAADILAVDAHLAGAALTKAGYHIDKGTLSIALYAGNAQYFALPDGKGYAVKGLFAHLIVSDKVLYPKNSIFGLSLGLADGQLNVSAYHQAGDVRFGNIRYVMGTHGAAVADNSNAVTKVLDLIELVGDKYDGVACLAQELELLKQFLGLLRSKNRGRLIQYKYLGAAYQRLYYFNLLLDADRNILDLCQGINVKVIFFAYRPGQLHSLILVEAYSLFRLYAQHYVFRNGKRGHQNKVLVHHAYTHFDGLQWGGELYLFAPYDNAALVRLFNAEKQLHQGGLAGAVFAADGVYLALFRGEAYIVVGHYAVIVYFCDVFHHKEVLHLPISFCLFKKELWPSAHSVTARAFLFTVCYLR